MWWAILTALEINVAEALVAHGVPSPNRSYEPSIPDRGQEDALALGGMGAGFLMGDDDSLLDLGSPSDVNAQKLLDDAKKLDDAGLLNDIPLVVFKEVEKEHFPDKDDSDKGALAKEALKKRTDVQAEGEAILKPQFDAHGDMMLVVRNEEDEVNFEDLTSSKKERLMSGEFLLISGLVLICWAITAAAGTRQIHYIQMPLICTIAGLLVGGALNIVGVSSFLGYLEFNDDVFFMVLLPPIIFDSGVNLNVQAMHRNATLIMYFAFVTTFLSFVISSFGFAISMLILPFDTESLSAAGILSYGSLISATDPVSVIALFKEVTVAASLKAVVTGESLMNDAISISLYRTFTRIESMGLIPSILAFFVMFCGSVLVGMICGWVPALIFKMPIWLTREMQLSLMVLFSYIAYLLAEVMNCSGIVAILFCGVSQSVYTLPNVDEVAATSFRMMIGTLSHLAESVAFIYLGMAICFINIALGDAIAITIITLFVVSLSRILAIILTSYCLELFHNIKIPQASIIALSLCGLRGAVAFGLAKHARHDYGHELGNLILVGTLSYSLFTVIVLGPLIPAALDYLGFSAPKETAQVDKLPSDLFGMSPSASPRMLRRTQSFAGLSAGIAPSEATEEHRLVRILKLIHNRLVISLLSAEALERRRVRKLVSPRETLPRIPHLKGHTPSSVDSALEMTNDPVAFDAAEASNPLYV